MVASSSCSFGTILLTKPKLMASGAEIISPVKTISRAFLRPTSRDNGAAGPRQIEPDIDGGGSKLGILGRHGKITGK